MPRNRRTAAPSGDLLTAAIELDEVTRALKHVVTGLVVAAHDRGATWEDIGNAFGVSWQAARERFGPNSRALRRRNAMSQPVACCG